LAEVQVTGSRIARPELQSTTPIEILSAKDIEATGLINTADVLRDLPGVGVSGISSANSNFSTSGGGVNTLNLRNLGDQRTLVLVNGRRFVSGVPGTPIVDLNMIPTAFIDRIDVITGGASAVYGSDAVAGVVNIVLKNHFEGVELRGQGGGATEGGANTREGSITLGNNFADGRGNAMINISEFRDSGLWSKQRAISTTDTSITKKGIFGAYSSFNPQGNLYLTDATGNPQDGLFTFAGTDNKNPVYYDGSQGFNRDAYRRITIPTDRTLVSAVANYQITESQQFYTEANYGYTHTHTALEPFSLCIGPCGATDNVYGGTGAGISLNNPYVPSALLAIAQADNALIADPVQGPANFGYYDPSCTTATPGSDCITSIGIRKRLTGIAIRSTDATRQTERIVAGFKGDVFGSRFNYDLSYMYGRTTEDQTSTGQVNVLNVRNALDAVNVGGSIVCADPVAVAQGCVPLNVFGANSITPAAAAYVNAPGSEYAVISQQVFSGAIDGALFKLPAGDVHGVLGAEHRTEMSQQDFDALTNSGLNGGNALPNVAGAYSVSEVFTEVSVPLLTGRKLAKELSLEGAARSSNYSTVGHVSTWNLRLNYAPDDNVRLRAAYSHAVRAPGISELYSAPGQTFPTGLSDPCDATNSPTGAILEACKKIAAIGAHGLPAYNFLDYQTITGFNGGNPHLGPETAKTETLGLVFTPTWIQGFSTTVDYFDIKIDSAVGSADYATEITQCLLTGQFCSQVFRDPNTGKLTRVDQSLINVATVETAGLDLQSKYRLPLPSRIGGGALDFGLSWTHLTKYTVLSEPGAPVETFVGQIGTPRDRGVLNLSYSNQGLTAGWTVRYQSAAKDQVNLDNVSKTQLPFNNVPAYFYHDLNLRYAFDRAGFLGKSELFGGIRNLLDKKPPFLPTGMASQITGTETAPDSYDAIGRQIFAGFDVKL
jgi:outer membrane receptor protein involved in Fe transport